jgi:glycosyltransferase involved in cell wall biosynthesis
MGKARSEELPRVLFVSKPVAAPFHDGSQVLVRNLANHVSRHRPVVMGVGQQAGFAPHVEVEHVYAQSGRFAPSLLQNVRPLWRLLSGRRDALWHFVFAPNVRSCQVVRAVRALKSRPTIQTIASPPRSFDAVEQLLFGDVVVAQSHATAERMRSSLTRDAEIHVIRPPFASPTRPGPAEVARLRQQLALLPQDKVVVYAGDLEFSRGAERVAKLVRPLTDRDERVIFVFACRQKTPRAAAIAQQLQSNLDQQVVRFCGELPNLITLLALTDVMVFPVEDLFAKVDIPIALLEAMDLGVPVVVPTEGPASELSACRRAEKDTIGEWVTAVLQLLDDTPVRAAVVQAQHEHVSAEFAAKVVAARYEDLYQRLLFGS